MILKDRPGMKVYVDHEGHLVKEASDEANKEALWNAWRFLQTLKDTPYIPQPEHIEAVGDRVILTREYAQESPREEWDTEAIRHNATKLLWTLRQRNVIHGDSTRSNFIIRDNIPVLFDWDQAIFAWEPKPQKRPAPDVYYLLRALCDMGLDPSRVLRRWRACREALSFYYGWGTFLDLGCHLGDLGGLSAIDGLKCHGVDGEYIRPCVETARELWGHMGCTFEKEDIPTWLGITTYHWNVIMMFSTWPYIVQQQGIEIAKTVLASCIDRSDVFLFETQLWGDGPGPVFLKGLEDVEVLLSICGAQHIEKLITIPVGGREAERTVFLVR